MKKILLLTPFDLFPPVHGGSTSVYYILRHISRNNQVHALLSHLYSQEGRVNLVHQNIQIQYCPRSIFDRLKVLSFLINPYYFKSAYEIMKNSNSDVIQCQVLWTAFAGIFLKKKFKKPLILVEHNIEYLKFKGFKKTKLFTYFLKRIEKIACSSADKIVVFSEIDKAHLLNLYNIQEDKVEIITPCPDLDILKENKQAGKVIRERYGVGDDDVILTFVGNLEYLPNVIAVRNIAERIYPTIIQKYPNSKFIIIGQSYEHILKYKRENMLFTGYLSASDFADHLSASDVMMVPIDSGSGVRRKILEAAACSRPTVSTKKGAEGLDFINNEEIIVTGKVDGRFVASVVKLIEDEELRRTIGKNARKKVIKQYSWEKEIIKFEKIYREVVREEYKG